MWRSSPAPELPSAGPGIRRGFFTITAWRPGTWGRCGRTTPGHDGNCRTDLHQDRHSQSRQPPADVDAAVSIGRQRPPFVRLPRAAPATAVAGGSCPEDGEGEKGAHRVLYCQSIKQNKHATAGWEHVRAIRVLMGRGLTTRSSHSYLVHAGNETVELGTVPLAPDGSFAVEVPADMPIALQAVDAEGRSELNEMSWIYVRPGEVRGCVGCTTRVRRRRRSWVATRRRSIAGR